MLTVGGQHAGAFAGEFLWFSRRFRDHLWRRRDRSPRSRSEWLHRHHHQGTLMVCVFFTFVLSVTKLQTFLALCRVTACFTDKCCWMPKHRGQCAFATRTFAGVEGLKVDPVHSSSFAVSTSSARVMCTVFSTRQGFQNSDQP